MPRIWAWVVRHNASRSRAHRRGRSRQDRPAIPCTACIESTTRDMKDLIYSPIRRDFRIWGVRDKRRIPKTTKTNLYQSSTVVSTILIAEIFIILCFSEAGNNDRWENRRLTWPRSRISLTLPMSSAISFLAAIKSSALAECWGSRCRQ